MWHPSRYRFLMLWMIFIPLLLVCTTVHGQDYSCGSLRANHRIDDYRDPSPDARHHIKQVEDFHFDSDVQTLKNSHHAMANLNYTLRHVPNHPYALHTLIRLHQRVKKESPGLDRSGLPIDADCYLRRAIQFRPRDPTVHMLYGIFHHQDGRLDDALAAYLRSRELNSRYPELEYNLGLLYFDREEYDKALKHAKRAYNLGYPLPGLRNKLQQIGRWP